MLTMKAPTSMSSASTTEIVVITTVGCPYCKRTKEALESAGLSYREVELSSNLEALRQVKQVTKKSTIPQV